MTGAAKGNRSAPLRMAAPDCVVDRPSNPRRKRPAPISVRVSEDERDELKRRAGSLPLSTFIRQAVLGDDAVARRSPRAVSADRVLLAKVLAALGQSRIIGNLHRLAEAAESGSLYVDDQVSAAIRQACEDVRILRLAVLQALGRRKPGDPAAGPGAGFNTAARGRDDRPSDAADPVREGSE
ncbi:hypothetical protein GGD81_004763 [Rhodobium orientis]|uniref:Bacterial mobilisation domain-containing protein n=1 Tax=Rhodobium orientis TaxID=34017 RepID=A0A327JF93_9HYPH|nr:hypothetical protein [Rhodobium orientis]MBB4305681.1 hypothetical protein [Rhodobium orientis]MBK5948425.1 hypothetical protein [Rhodobium orientis]RAI24601.1 hypothetical protein CH339_21915 [Rhodobium orientis]